MQEESTDRARALLRDTLNGDKPIVASPLLSYEVTTILRHCLCASAPLLLEQALVYLDDCLSVPVGLRNPPGLRRRALSLADAFGLPAAYDEHYLGMAEQLDRTLWTDDRRVLRTLGGRLPYVRAISHYDLRA